MYSVYRKYLTVWFLVICMFILWAFTRVTRSEKHLRKPLKRNLVITPFNIQTELSLNELSALTKRRFLKEQRQKQRQKFKILFAVQIALKYTDISFQCKDDTNIS